MSGVEYDILSSDNGSWMTNITAFLPTVTTTAASIYLPASYYSLIRDVHFVLNGFVISLGLLFNSIALMVFASSPTLRHTTTGHYLMALSLADSTYLSGDLLRWLASKSHSFTEYTKYGDLVNKYEIVCKLVNTIRYTAMLCSSSITVAITVERFLTIKFPLKIGRISTLKTARLIIVVIAVVSVAFSIFPLWCLKIRPVTLTGQPACQIDLNRMKLYKTMLWVSIRMLTLILPSVIIAFLTVWIIVVLRKREKDQRHLQSHVSTTDRQSVIDRQLNLMLISVAIAFVVLRLPYTIIWDINHFKRSIWKPLDPWLSYRIYVAYKLTDILAITNYAINFFLYFLCGSTFRRQLKSMFHCGKRQTRSQVSVTTASSFVSRRSSSLAESSSRANYVTMTQRHQSDSYQMSNRRRNENSFTDIQTSETKM